MTRDNYYLFRTYNTKAKQVCLKHGMELLIKAEKEGTSRPSLSAHIEITLCEICKDIESICCPQCNHIWSIEDVRFAKLKEKLANREFFELMQAYRLSGLGDPQANDAYEAVKNYLKKEN